MTAAGHSFTCTALAAAIAAAVVAISPRFDVRAVSHDVLVAVLISAGLAAALWLLLRADPLARECARREDEKR